MTYAISPTSNDDQQTILELWQRNLPTAVEGRYDWLYRSGPADDWLLEDEHDVAVGSVGLMRRKFQIHDRLVTAGQAVDMNVDQAHRSVGPALQLQRTAIAASAEQDFAFVYGLCDRRSQLVLRRTGYRLLGDVGRWVRPLTSEPFLPSSIRGKLRRPCCALANLAMRLTGADLWNRRPNGTRVEVLDRFDERFDRLWMRAAQHFPILGDRSAEFLNWRFSNAPELRYRALTLSDRDDRLRGYLVYQFDGATAHVADFLFEGTVDLGILLSELIALARRWGMESVVVESLIPDSIAELLKKFGFWRRPSSWPFLVYAPKPTLTQWQDQGLFDLANWYLTRADVDTDF